MNNFDFTFQDSYTGFWDIEGVGNHIGCPVRCTNFSSLS